MLENSSHDIDFIIQVFTFVKVIRKRKIILFLCSTNRELNKGQEKDPLT